MSYEIYPYNGYAVAKIDDISVDFPENGIAIGDIAIIGVKNESDAVVNVEVTLSSKIDITEGTADWIQYAEVAIGEDELIVFDPGPNGVRMSCTGSGAKAWVKS